MPLESPQSTFGRLPPQVMRIGNNSCGTPQGDEVYFISNPVDAAPPVMPGEEGVTVTRHTADTWEIAVSRAAVVGDVHYYTVTSTVGKRTTTSCTADTAVIDFTRPIKATMTWTYK